MAAGQIDEDTSDLKDMVEKYPVEYRDCKAQIAGLLVASETRRRGIDMQSPKLEQVMLQYLSNNDTLLSEDGIKTLNAYALKGYRLITDYPLFDKPTSREEFLEFYDDFSKKGAQCSHTVLREKRCVIIFENLNRLKNKAVLLN